MNKLFKKISWIFDSGSSKSPIKINSIQQ